MPSPSTFLHRATMVAGILLAIAALDTCRGGSTACAMTAGCGIGEPACPGDSVTVAVAGLDVSWSPGCFVAWLEVLDSSGTTMWRLINLNNRLQPSVRYGQLPSGTVQAAPATNLVSGTRYRVTVRRAVPDSLPLMLRGGGTTTFVAP